MDSKTVLEALDTALALREEEGNGDLPFLLNAAIDHYGVIRVLDTVNKFMPKQMDIKQEQTFVMDTTQLTPEFLAEVISAKQETEEATTH